MVKDTIFYDILGVAPEANDLELKKAYRKQAIRLHPDKNPDDPEAAKKFQELAEAYGILKEKDSRALYDELGKAGMEEKKVTGEDIDPTEFFNNVFGGSSFKDWIGELSMVNDMSKAAEVLDEDSPEGGASTGPASSETSVAQVNGQMGDLNVKNENSTYGMTSEDLEKKKKQAMSKEKRQEMMRLAEESRLAKEQRVDELAGILVGKIEQYEAARKNPDALAQFTKKLQEEIDDMKVESFGLELLHLIGKIYKEKARAKMAASKTFGVSRIITGVKSSSATVKNGYSILKAAVDAQSTMEASLRRQDELDLKKQSGQQLTPQEQYEEMEMQKLLMGKVVATLWATTRFEVSGILNKVCTKVLSDKTISRKDRANRAKAVLFFGETMASVQRSSEEAEEANMFEELMADATSKKSKKQSPADMKNFEMYMQKMAQQQAEDLEETESDSKP